MNEDLMCPYNDCTHWQKVSDAWEIIDYRELIFGDGDYLVRCNGCKRIYRCSTYTKMLTDVIDENEQINEDDLLDCENI